LRRGFFLAAALAAVMALLPKPPDLLGGAGDRVQHMIAFATLGALAAMGWRERPAVPLFAVIAAFGGAIEIFQGIPSLHRDPDFIDWLADMVAALAAMGLARLALPRL
jgi:hypothetical protein